MDAIFSALLLLFSLLTGSDTNSESVRQLAIAYINTAAGQTIIPQNPAYEGILPANSIASAIKKDPQPEAEPVRGIYVTAHSAGGARMESLLQLVDDTELNSMVIDIKDDNGYITYPTSTPSLLRQAPQRNISATSAP